MLHCMDVTWPVTLKMYYYFIKVKDVQQDLDQTTVPKWGASLSPLRGSNNGNPTLGIEPEFTCIKHITADLYIIDHCLNPNPNPKP